jgi:probable F420-dependent oxidoreductase
LTGADRTRYGISIKYQLSADRTALRDLAQAAEALNFDSVWLSEHTVIPLHYGSRYAFSAEGVPPFSSSTVWPHALCALAYVAAVTERIRLATAVIPVLTRHPLALAKEAATVDRLSGGRLELGLGAGWLREEATALGYLSDRPGGRLAEAITIMRAAWSPGATQYTGEFWSFAEVEVQPKPVSGRDLPIWIGGSGPAALKTTVHEAIGNIVVGGPSETRDVADALRRHRADLRVCVASDLEDPGLAERLRQLKDAGADDLIVRCTGDPTAENIAASIRRMEIMQGEIR